MSPHCHHTHHVTTGRSQPITSPRGCVRILSKQYIHPCLCACVSIEGCRPSRVINASINPSSMAAQVSELMAEWLKCQDAAEHALCIILSALFCINIRMIVCVLKIIYLTTYLVKSWNTINNYKQILTNYCIHVLLWLKINIYYITIKFFPP